MSTATLASSANGPRLPSASLMSRPWPLIACACVCIHTWNASRVLGSNERKISSSSTVGETCVVLSLPPSGIVRRRRAAGRQLDVGLAEQRLLAQDRPRVRRQRRVARVELDHDVRAAGRLVGLDRLDLADRDAGDAHVGLLGELGRLGERRDEAVALRLERDRAAEREPQEQQQAEAGQGEAGHDGDASEGGGGFLHRIRRRTGPGTWSGSSASGSPAGRSACRAAGWPGRPG